jgi:hypothetical protein
VRSRRGLVNKPVIEGSLVWLNLLLPIILGWVIVLERRISKIEGFCLGRRSAKKEGAFED